MAGTVRIQLSKAVSMTISHIWQKKSGGAYWYKRRYPKAVREMLELKDDAMRLVALGTNDSIRAARQAVKLAAADEKEWAKLLRGDPVTTREAATALLESFGVSPSDPMQTEDARDLFIDHVQGLVSEEDERKLHHDEIDDPALVLPPIEAAALRIVRGGFRASDVLAFYLETSSVGKSKTFARIPTYAFGKLIAACGDKEVNEYRRDDVRKLVASMQAQGAKTATIRRQLNSLVAGFSLVIREKELTCVNPFSKSLIPGEGLDGEDRETLTAAEMQTLGEYVDSAGTREDLLHMLGLLMDTGARLAEVAGLLLTDVVLDGPVPYLNLLHHTHRRLKNDSSIRRVPLTGRALEAARKAVRHAELIRSPFLFSRYTDTSECRATAASGTLNKRLKAMRINKTCHCLRHTMRDRLRAIECPTEIVDRLGGWATPGVGAAYGKGYPLANLQDWMLDAVTGAKAKPVPV
jgi:integrase